MTAAQFLVAAWLVGCWLALRGADAEIERKQNEGDD